MRGVSLREYLEVKISGIATELQAAEAERERLREQVARAATRVELAAVADKLDLIQTEIDKLNGRRSLTSAIAYISGGGISSLVVGVVVYLLSHHP